VGLHCFGFVAETTHEAADLFYPGWEQMFTKMSQERGAPLPTRLRYDATRSSHGAYFIGDPAAVAEKAVAVSAALGGVHSIALQMTNPRLGPLRPAAQHRAAGHRGGAARATAPVGQLSPSAT
jgi:hypothetical protein